MNMVLMLFYSIFLVVMPVVIYQIMMMMLGESKSTLSHYLWTYIMMIYLWMVFSIAGIGSIWDIFAKGGWSASLSQANINLIPFQSEGLFTYYMNILMVMPLGFLLPYLWKNFRNIFKVALTGFLFSVFIEFSQLFTNRLVDIDDLMMNTVGAVLGYIIWRVIGEYFFSKNQLDRTKALSVSEPVVYIVLACTCNFLLFNFAWFI
ncbi:VanZ-like protein [Desulfitobacterium hafniense]|uniref:VanZ-like protein n=1 Tax=Desulfitobacterium hafniense TaxID=49338 RepID=A0A098B9Y7_DESHA|nr:VanZ family protein [Desulfitobacterium hafniense]CDX05185.1 VanZ-like protein [Desulfitobacterium hafniense]